jgi:hypothetical protein
MDEAALFWQLVPDRSVMVSENVCLRFALFVYYLF